MVSGGTQANLIVISSILRPHESVVSANTGHIFTNETGAIEATGHKSTRRRNQRWKIKTRRYSECARCTYQCSASGKAEVGLHL